MPKRKRRGRPRKAGARTASGRLSRAKPQAVTFDRGTDAAQRKVAQYGSQGCDAIGRAYMAGLLGERDGDAAKAMLDTARKLAKDYRRAYEQAPYRGTLGDRTAGSVVDLDHERIKRTEENLREVLKWVAGMGRGVKLAFHDLVLSEHPDSGPMWLDQVIWAKAHGKEPHPAAREFLKRALDPLDILANE